MEIWVLTGCIQNPSDMGLDIHFLQFELSASLEDLKVQKMDVQTDST